MKLPDKAACLSFLKPRKAPGLGLFFDFRVVPFREGTLAYSRGRPENREKSGTISGFVGFLSGFVGVWSGFVGFLSGFGAVL